MIDVVQKLWGFCHKLRHDGVGYTEYIEQITYLLFIKMADEKGIALPKGCTWPELTGRSGTDLLESYQDLLRKLGKESGILGQIFSGAQSRITKPASLKQLLTSIDEIEWTALTVDVKSEAYEGLLEKAASEGKKGAGGYFTPRPLIRTIVRRIQPDPRVHKDFTICDPACGVGGFLVVAYEWLIKKTEAALSREQWKHIREKTYHGQDISEQPRRLALMNLYLHQVDPDIALGDSIYDPPSRQRYDIVLTNPPFGTKGAGEIPQREDFTVETSNKQLNFVQHVITILKPGGRAAIVLPDNCLFADQAGQVFEILTKDCDLHTVLRLPHGTFSPYCQGVKANVIFFTKGSPTRATWIYDNRTNVAGVTKKERKLDDSLFAEFEKSYGEDPFGRARRKENERFKKFTIEQIRDKDYKLDSFKWIEDQSVENSDDLPEPAELAGDAVSELEEAVNELNAILTELENGNGGKQ